MKKTAHIALAVVALMGISVSGCSGIRGGDEQTSSAVAAGKIEQDIDRISAALSMAEMTASHAPANSDEIASELVGNGILISYPSYNGGRYMMSTTRSDDRGQKITIGEVAFISLGKGISKDVCEQINTRAGLVGIQRLHSPETMTPLERYNELTGKKKQVLGKAVCYESSKVILGGFGDFSVPNYTITSVV
ncbi:hypothetical protein ACTG16_22385 [Aeromonas sp. 23P]|uniref:hypothetical protein n=1 Tax=Aeromonas sp. 23P TaxID=3452716 RepID=UPI003F78D2F9